MRCALGDPPTTPDPASRESQSARIARHGRVVGPAFQRSVARGDNSKDDEIVWTFGNSDHHELPLEGTVPESGHNLIVSARNCRFFVSSKLFLAAARRYATESGPRRSASVHRAHRPDIPHDQRRPDDRDADPTGGCTRHPRDKPTRARAPRAGRVSHLTRRTHHVITLRGGALGRGLGVQLLRNA